MMGNKTDKAFPRGAYFLVEGEKGIMSYDLGKSFPPEPQFPSL